MNIAKLYCFRCQHANGGFGGGPDQIAHIAPTYAAINALVIIGTPKAYSIIDREKLRKFLWALRLSNGSFCMHRDGEVDIRGAYCALAVATLTNIACGKLFEGTAEWVVRYVPFLNGTYANQLIILKAFKKLLKSTFRRFAKML